jgi:hypothetical protein
MSANYPALAWGDLGPPVQGDLAAKGLGAAWFSSIGKDEELRRTVLVLYVKMSGMKIGGRRLWDFVGRQLKTTPGRLEFIVAPQVEAFMHALATSRTFTKPEKAPSTDWDSREFVATLQLHFKHFNGWPDKNHVEVHIDPHGLYSGPGIGRINVVEMIVHACTLQAYKNVGSIQRKLIEKGWGRTVLNK